MKRIIGASILLLNAMTALAQLEMRNLNIVRNGNKIQIDFDASIDKKAIGGNYKLIMTPIIYNGNEFVALADIVVESRRTRIVDARNRITAPKNVVTAENGQNIHYRALMDYQDWIVGSALRLDKRSVGCCSEQKLVSVVLANKLPMSDLSELSMHIDGKIIILTKNADLPAVAQSGNRALADKVENQKQILSNIQSKLDKVSIDFTTGSPKLNPDEPGNRDVLSGMIDILRSPKDVLTGKIDITGYASPEGHQTANYALAQSRAIAVRNYILDSVPKLRPNDFNIINGGENWEGLRNMVEESRMPSRWQVLDIIDNVPVEISYATNTSRKKQLMDLNGGKTWKYMGKNFFPHLRMVVSVAIYKTVQDVADSSSKQSWSNIPSHNTDLINQAIDLIGERASSAALKILLPISNDPRSWNPLGVCYLLDDNVEKAKKYFNKAAAAGYAEAMSNIEQFNINSMK